MANVADRRVAADDAWNAGLPPRIVSGCLALKAETTPWMSICRAESGVGINERHGAAAAAVGAGLDQTGLARP